MLSVTILGCGSSGGVPRVGQGWGKCNPNNPKNRRRRCSILVTKEASGAATQVLVDTGPDLREQLISADIRRLDAVLYTHPHADHTHGIDDLRGLVILTVQEVKLRRRRSGLIMAIWTRLAFVLEISPIRQIFIPFRLRARRFCKTLIYGLLTPCATSVMARI